MLNLVFNRINEIFKKYLPIEILYNIRKFYNNTINSALINLPHSLNIVYCIDAEVVPEDNNDKIWYIKVIEYVYVNIFKMTGVYRGYMYKLIPYVQCFGTLNDFYSMVYTIKWNLCIKNNNNIKVRYKYDPGYIIKENYIGFDNMIKTTILWSRETIDSFIKTERTIGTNNQTSEIIL
jgi:hypothetical protein